MTEPSTEQPSETPVVFRRGKKKKAAYRQRDNEPVDNDVAAPTTTDASTGNSQPAAAEPNSSAAANVPIKKEDSDGEKEHVDEDEDAGLSVAEVLRLRNARKGKTRGVDLRADSVSKVVDEPAPTELVVKEEMPGPAAAVVAGLGRRFAAQTGLVGELVNRHMEEYIESELARRKQATGMTTTATASGSSATASHDRLQESDQAAASAAGGLVAETPAQPATRGKLHEVDLGQEMRQRNVVETRRAAKRLRGEEVGEDGADASEADKGKPAKRNRRPSEDALRDKMVEQFLLENKMENYQMEDIQQPEDGRPHDARVAEEFRREFMEAIYQRNRRRRPAINQHKRAPKRDESEILKGPKLGGSRNSRAAIRDILLKQANEKRAAERS
ncbi:hypothetical protein PpBr36_00411 [Pyricularia pennisetigena]|uniref:hypothetical protein n=1 Tax=Pyricularia pennisetigena TaxID=1578925 RepID=UPI001150CAD8|nr:hypothetical protein PpBr36_00411 [Pyricularia pennisetigena]TLS29627.1 hypothetical protein PpBr36_00411 [Pyricularia pennisetigena]